MYTILTVQSSIMGKYKNKAEKQNTKPKQKNKKKIKTPTECNLPQTGVKQKKTAIPIRV